MKGVSQRLVAEFSQAARERAIFIFALSAVLTSMAAASLVTGPATLSLMDAYKGLVFGEGDAAIIMQEIRLPRLILSISVGGALGLCGAAAQSLTRNPLQILQSSERRKPRPWVRWRCYTSVMRSRAPFL